MKRMVFISLPMSGIDDELVKANIERAKEAYLAITKLDISQVAFLNNFEDPATPPYNIQGDKRRIWYLGRALQVLSKCDEAIFGGKWKQAKGCMIEHEVCTMYKIPAISIEWSDYHG